MAGLIAARDGALPPATTLSDLPDKVRLAVAAATTITFLALFVEPLVGTARTWWTDPEAGHGLLLAPLAVWLAWQRGRAPDAKASRALGISMLLAAVLFRYVSALAAEAFVGRASMFLALGGVVVWGWGVRQLLHWWLPTLLLALSVPLPDMLMGALALPLQFKASQMGAAMLSWRGIPVHLDGNVIRLPGHDLFVTEACSGLRSLTALLSLGVLLGGLLLKSPAARIAIVALSIPVAVVINGVRVFVTGFLVVFVDPKLAEGFSHLTEGWLLFLVAFAILGAITWGAMSVEEYWQARRAVSGASSGAADA